MEFYGNENSMGINTKLNILNSMGINENISNFKTYFLKHKKIVQRTQGTLN